MKVMQAFDVRWEATAILLADFHLIVTKSRPFGFLHGHHDAAI
jgi:hypothetical protein